MLAVAEGQVRERAENLPFGKWSQPEQDPVSLSCGASGPVWSHSAQPHTNLEV